MRLFEFNGTDYTHHIQVPNYTVNRQPVFTSWEDANGITHRDVTRQRISGSFTVWFDSPAAQIAFFAALNAAMAGTGYLHCRLYINNLDTVVDADVFVDYSIKNELPLLGRGNHGGTVIKLTER